jgi:hypothetical protein
MSFHVVRHEHPTIFVVIRQTYETYRFTIGNDVALAHVGPPSDLAEARRTAIPGRCRHHLDSGGAHRRTIAKSGSRGRRSGKRLLFRNLNSVRFSCKRDRSTRSVKFPPTSSYGA